MIRHKWGKRYCYLLEDIKAELFLESHFFDSIRVLVRPEVQWKSFWINNNLVQLVVYNSWSRRELILFSLPRNLVWYLKKPYGWWVPTMRTEPTNTLLEYSCRTKISEAFSASISGQIYLGLITGPLSGPCQVRYHLSRKDSENYRWCQNAAYTEECLLCGCQDMFFKRFKLFLRPSRD